MSGPKCASYDVERNRVREERMRRQLRQEIVAIETRMGHLDRKWDEGRERFGESFPEARAWRNEAFDRDENRIWILSEERNRLRGTEQRERQRFEREHNQHELREIMAEAAAKRQRERMDKRTSDLERILGRIKEGGNEEYRQGIDQLAKRAMQSESDQDYEHILTEIRLRVEQLNKRTRLHHSALSACEQMSDALEGLAGARVEELRGEVQRAAKGEIVLRNGLSDEVSIAAHEARENEDRDYAEKVLIDELEALGYEVDTGFETETPGARVLANAALGEYRVEVAFGTEKAPLEVAVVREESTGEGSTEQALRDREMEEHWCADFARSMQRLDEQGVRIRVTSHARPGEMPVRTVRREHDAMHETATRTRAHAA